MAAGGHFGNEKVYNFINKHSKMMINVSVITNFDMRNSFLNLFLASGWSEFKMAASSHFENESGYNFINKWN